MAERTTGRRFRCAVYTRKSSEEGLEQAFNSLDAQREACEAYVTSQRHEGWLCLRDRYDDGGFSGGTMERPALKRLMADIAAGRVDIVVVYKVDRLTRALGDFARLVELFDRHAVSFVSVTQAFNTTSSMGRLTLNVLLSFAQFEREVTGERIRDKIAASKRKGLWMGGHPALGYEVCQRKLVVNEAEAETVRFIFRRYRDLGSVRTLRAELDEAGIRSKLRVATDGTRSGGQRFSTGALYAMLRNRLYRGEVTHKGQVYAGEHAAIIEADLFEAVQATLAGNRIERVSRHDRDPSPLRGLLFDAAGERLTPSHAVKTGVRYRYYVSRHLVAGERSEHRGLRLPATPLEALVRTRIGALLSDPAELMATVGCGGSGPRLIAAAHRKTSAWSVLPAADLHAALLAFVSRITILADRVEIALRPGCLAAWIGGASSDNDPGQADALISAPVRLKQRGHEQRLVLCPSDGVPGGNAALVKVLARAHAIHRRIIVEGSSIEDVAAEQGTIPSYVTRLLRLAYLAPDIVTAILSGRHDPDLTVTRLLADTRFPLDWAEQRRAFASL